MKRRRIHLSALPQIRSLRGPAVTIVICLVVALFLVGAVLNACTSEPEATPIPAPTVTPTPTTAPASDDRASLVDQFKQDAEVFEYTIGKPGGALTSATISEPLTFNLAIANDASSSGVLGYLYEGLTRTSWLTNEVEPELAESWKSSEDGLTWTAHLCKDVKCHDDEPFTAHDVDSAFNRIIYNHDIPASSRPALQFRILDEDTGEQAE